MTSPVAPPFLDWPRIPYVGVGCIVERNGKLLLVRDHTGLWATPGGHLDFGETPAGCAARETREETGVVVSNVDFVAVTNDVLDDLGKHYVTVWMRADAAQSAITIEDDAEIAEVGWFSPDAMPEALHTFFLNLISGHCLPRVPQNLPESLKVARDAIRTRMVGT